MEERIEKICDSINFNSSIPANMINNETLRYIFKKFYPNVTDDFSISEDNLPKIRDKFLRFCSDYPLEFKLVGTIILSLILFIGMAWPLLLRKLQIAADLGDLCVRRDFLLSSLFRTHRYHWQSIGHLCDSCNSRDAHKNLLLSLFARHGRPAGVALDHPGGDHLFLVQK